MKKHLAISITLIILLVIISPIPAFAAGNTLTFSIESNISVIRGDAITVPVNVSNNPGFTAVGLVVNYDPDVLTITGVSAPVSAMPLNPQFALTSNPGTQWISLINMNLNDWTGNGPVANVTFNVKSDAPLGVSAIALTFTGVPDGTPCNSNGDIIRNSVRVTGSVDVTDGGGIGGVNTTQGTSSAPPADGGGSGEFIGNLSGNPEKAVSNASTNTAGFGRVPQTGVADTAEIIAAAVVILVVTIVLWGRILLSKRKKKSDNG